MGEILEVYRRTRKPRDLAFNTYVCRPLAAAFVVVLRGARFTPNQVSFFSLLLAWCAAALLVWLPGRVGWWLGVLVLELSYVFDCVDGMLARERGVQSQAGHLLDFLMDEIKAFFVLGAVALGAYRREGDPELLIWGVVGLACLASGIGLTTFQRRPEIMAIEGTNPDNRQGAKNTKASPSKSAVRLAERVGSQLIHYPSYIWLVPLLNEPRVYLYPYVVVNGVYMLRALSVTALRHGRFSHGARSTSAELIDQERRDVGE
ncbi:MAG: CDP-alcohol phosphatidyltransferase family protein [Polyangiaceae bacterium]